MRRRARDVRFSVGRFVGFGKRSRDLFFALSRSRDLALRVFGSQILPTKRSLKLELEEQKKTRERQISLAIFSDRLRQTLTWHEREHVCGCILCVCNLRDHSEGRGADVLSARRDGRERGVRARTGFGERAAPMSVLAPPNGTDFRPGLGPWPSCPDAGVFAGIGRNATRAVAGRRPRVPVVPARVHPRAPLHGDLPPSVPARRLDVRAPAPCLLGLLLRRRGRAEPEPKRVHG